MNIEEWYEKIRHEGTSGEMVSDVLEDWTAQFAADRKELEAVEARHLAEKQQMIEEIEQHWKLTFQDSIWWQAFKQKYGVK